MSGLLLWSLAGLSVLACGLGLWQWQAGRSFPLERRRVAEGPWPRITVLKPLKGVDAATEACLESWLDQDYPGEWSVVFGVGSREDPAFELVERLLRRHGQAPARLVVCDGERGANAKVAKLIRLAAEAAGGLVVVSDADVHAPWDLLRQVSREAGAPGVGLVCCLYRLARPVGVAMHWEAVAINVDFWSQVLQARTLRPMDFALGAVMAIWKDRLESVGGFEALADHLADDYHLGQRVARSGGRVSLCPVVVEVREPTQGWGAIWRHQLRWARTIRVCRPAAYGWSVLAQPLLWPGLWLGTALVLAGWGVTGFTGVAVAAAGAVTCVGWRLVWALDLQRRMVPDPTARSPWWAVVLRDLLGVAVWGGAMTGRQVLWRGARYHVQSDGRLERLEPVWGWKELEGGGAGG